MKAFRFYIIILYLSFCSYSSFSQSEPIQIDIKIPWFGKKLLTYSLEKGDTISLNFTASKKKKGDSPFGKLANPKMLKSATKGKFKSLDKLKENKAVAAVPKDVDIASIANIKKLNAPKNKISEFTFFKQGGGPLFQGSNLSNFSKNFTIPEDGNYSLKFKNKSFLPSYFKVGITISKPLKTKGLILTTLAYDTGNINLIKKEFELDPKKNLSGNNEFLIPLQYDRGNPALLGLSYLVTTNPEIINQVSSTKEMKALDFKQASESFNFRKESYPSGTDPDIYFNLMSGKSSILKKPSKNYVGAIKAYEFNKAPLNLYIKNFSEVRKIKVYAVVNLYYLEIKKEK